MIPQITALNDTNTIPAIVPYPSFTFLVNNDLIDGNIDGLSAIRQTVQHILTTERYVYPIYASNYGVELEQLKGKNINYARAKISNIIKNALYFERSFGIRFFIAFICARISAGSSFVFARIIPR